MNRRWASTLLVLALLLVLPPWAIAQDQNALAIGTKSDSELLSEFKATFVNGDAVLTTWAGDAPCSGSWQGVICDRTYVVIVVLEDLNLQGTIPSAGWELPARMRSLSLFGNNLTGTIPEKLGLPPALLKLDLGRNQLTGTFPEKMRLPTGMLSLSFSFNQLSGPFPRGLELPSGIQEVLFAWNQFTGTVVGWELPDTLSKLSVDHNRISGSLSASWRLPRNLTWLDLGENQLTGTIPADWDLPLSLNTVPEAMSANGMGLHNNSLTGPLPSWPALTNATFFISPGNPGLCGPVPEAPRYKFYDFNVTSMSLGTNLAPLPACPGPSPPSPPPAPGGASGGGSSNTTAIVVGVVVGVLGGALCLLGLLYFVRRRRRRAQGEGDSEKAATPSEGKDGGAFDGQIQLAKASDGSWAQERASTPSEVPSRREVQGERCGRMEDFLPPIPPSPFILMREMVLASSEDSNGHSNQGMDPVSAELIASDPLLASVVSRYGSTPMPLTPPDSAEGIPTHRGKASEDGASGMGSNRQLEMDVKAWVIPFQHLQLRRMVGSGSFGRVYVASWKGATVAVKLLLDTATHDMVLALSSPLLHDLRQEAGMMALLRHPNVLTFLGLCVAPPCLVSEYCPRGSLFDCLRKARASPEVAKELDWPRRLKMARGAALGMLHLHSHEPPIVHRDLKSPNLLIAANWAVKVSDFNVSKILGERSIGSSLSVANPRWLAPEVLAGETHNFASDVFSFGVVLWELLTFASPWESVSNLWQVSKAVMEGKRLEIPPPDKLPGGTFEGLDAYIDLMKRCWAQDPAQRPTFEQLAEELRDLSTRAMQMSCRKSSQSDKAPARAERSASDTTGLDKTGPTPPRGVARTQ